MYPLMLCFLHSTHLTLGLVLEAGPMKTPIVFFGGESIEEGIAEQKCNILTMEVHRNM